MTLVYRANKQAVQKEVTDLGPGHYFNAKKGKHVEKGSKENACFVSSTPRQGEDKLLVSQKAKLGPGCYNYSDKNHKKNISDCKSVFLSKLDRIPEISKNNESKRTLKSSYCHELLEGGKTFWKDSKTEQKNKGKLMTGSQYQCLIKDSKMAKSIPSIPTWQQSYGYRYDQTIKQLVSNQNPHVLITHSQKIDPNEWKKHGPGHYFIRNQSSQKAFHWSKEGSNRSPVEIKHILQSPAPNAYQTSQRNSLSKQHTVGNALVSKQKRFQAYNEGDNSMRQMLLMNKMKRQFRQYMQNSVAQSPKKKSQSTLSNANLIKSLKQQKMRKVRQKTENSSGENYSSFKKQCFESVEKRFYEKSAFQDRNQLADKTNLAEDANGISSSMINSNSNSLCHSLSQSKLQDSSTIKRAPKVAPFLNEAERFQERRKENLGPGHYANSLKFSGKRGVTIKLTAERFNDKSDTIFKPGPGTYQVQQKYCKPAQHKARKLFRADFLKNSMEVNSIIDNSMEILYHKYGSYINYYIKEQKNQQKGEKGKRKSSFQKKMKTAAFLSSVHRECMGQAFHQRNSHQIDVVHSMSHQFKHKTLPRYRKPVINYQPPEKPDTPPGPGQFQIAKSLEKKTFNVTYS